jgi:Uma2 family endonuclease
MATLSKTREIMSVDEFLSWTPPHDGLWQLVDGEPCAMAPANRSHGAIQGELTRLLVNHLAEGDSPCSVLVTPGVVLNAKTDQNVRIPDLAVTCSRYETEEATVSEPVLLVEILSPSNQVETWINVWSYTTISSVREILVLQSRSIGAHVLRRRTDGTWPDQADAVDTGDLVLESIGFRTLLGAIYRTTRLAS